MNSNSFGFPFLAKEQHLHVLHERGQILWVEINERTHLVWLLSLFNLLELNFSTTVVLRSVNVCVLQSFLKFPKGVIFVISFEPISEGPTSKSFHERRVGVNVIGRFWRQRQENFIT